LRIGYQKAASTLVLLKQHGTLEKKLAPLNVEVKWLEFAAGPQLLEGLNLGSIDFGYVGEVPPVFALAAGAPLVYTAYELPTPEAEGILIPKDSPIRTIADLKGKKVAFNKGSDVHWLVVKALQDAGLKYADIQAAYLAPADARAAFQNGAVDAWAIWDPFFVAAQRQLGARVLTTAKGIVNRHQYFVSTRSFSEKNPEVVKILMQQLGEVGNGSGTTTPRLQKNSPPFKDSSQRLSKRVLGITNTFINRSTTPCWPINNGLPTRFTN
jgi:sulfonate transport system substrate-binding protein